MVREVESVDLVVVVVSVQLAHIWSQNTEGKDQTWRAEEFRNHRQSNKPTRHTKKTLWVSRTAVMNNNTRIPSDFSHTQ